MKIGALRVEGEKILSLIDACKNEFHAHSYSSRSLDTRILLFEGWSFLKRSVSATIVFDLEDRNSCRVVVAVASEGFGSEDPTFKKIIDFIIDYAEANFMKTKDADANIAAPTPKWSTRTPESFLKNCAKCSRQIPIASEDCEYCGVHQPDRKK